VPASRQIPLAAALLFGPALLATGLLVYGLLLGHVPAKPGALQAPPFVLWLIGTVFAAGGLGLLLSRLLPRLAAACGVIAFCAFVGTFNWIAFGPGDRDFSRGKAGTTPASSASPRIPVSEAGGRLVFGLFAGALDVLILYGLYRGLKRRKPAGGG